MADAHDSRALSHETRIEPKTLGKLRVLYGIWEKILYGSMKNSTRQIHHSLCMYVCVCVCASNPFELQVRQVGGFVGLTELKV